MLPTMQGLVEDEMYVYQAGIKIYGEDADYQWICAWIMV